MVNRSWHTASADNIYTELSTSKEGITSVEAQQRLKTYGSNKLVKKKDYTILKILLGQFKSFLVGLLLLAMFVSYFIGEHIDAYVIGVIIVLNALLGFIQEYRADKAVESLKKLSAPKAHVMRDGRVQEIDATQLVPGDILVLAEGDRIPADARLVEALSLEVDESALTGESNPVAKQSEILTDTNLTVADKKNMVFMNTTITRGRGTAIVVETGMSTEIGLIAKSISEQKAPETPLQKKLGVVAKNLGIGALVVSGAVFGLGILRGEQIVEMFTAAVSLAVAAVPEGLPAVVTITLALGLRRMAKSNALIRKLPVVETLGSATVICSDKTGTLTKNEMTVEQIYTSGNLIKVSGQGYTPEGDFSLGSKKLNISNSKSLTLALRSGTLCTTANLYNDDAKGWYINGDPTEGALIVSARKAGIDKELLKTEHKFISELPFDSNRKMMSVIYELQNKRIAYIKGAPEIFLEKASHVYTEKGLKKLTKTEREKIHKVLEAMSNEALRVLAVGYKYLPEKDKYTAKEVETQIVFVGLQAMIDPARPEAKPAIAKCTTAGIQTIMITGDHASTASAIARELGILEDKGKVVVGKDLENMSDEELEKIVDTVRVFARVSPQHKLRIVYALKKKGHVVAMTGDGVNDAPALKAADIGVAMGINGTDVAKDSADMVLADDNFASIVSAVEEGRGIFDNVKHFIRYLLSSNVGEVMAIFVAMLIGLPLPLIAVQILLMNLLTDGLPALALGVDPPVSGIMNRPPRDPKEGAITRSTWMFSILVGLTMMVGTVGVFWANLAGSVEHARTLAFTTLVMFQMFNIFNSRAERSILKDTHAIFNNKALLLAILGSISLQVLIVHWSVLQVYFETVGLSAMDWITAILIGASVILVVEVKKLSVVQKSFKA
ncbi:MAG: calcium-translocating P-type ATPase, SERCA-type [Candidatus Nanoarchaeia archaeon]|jgi:Ca2+-transporting ATPase|nr:calcium-translocating P-type ATPase, SERCA-type [Candidatus Nanoarchaeia archaeon]|tara:strand:- start:1827 stop:4517 length:2691 start_codon:yes stop_codon:yes gene_type:complete